jgi:hypothetical protein
VERYIDITLSMSVFVALFNMGLVRLSLRHSIAASIYSCLDACGSYHTFLLFMLCLAKQVKKLIASTSYESRLTNVSHSKNSG